MSIAGKERRPTKEKVARAKKNWTEIQQRLAPFTERKKIERVSTAGTWKDASSICFDPQNKKTDSAS